MNNSINRLLLVNVILWCCFLSTACASDLSKAKVGCVETILNAKVVKIDNKNQRLFVADQKLSTQTFIEKRNDVQTCLKKSVWNSDWAISVFTEEKYAGYKDDKNIIPLHKNNQWAKAYKLEYLNISETIIKTPALSPQEIKP